MGNEVSSPLNHRAKSFDSGTYHPKHLNIHGAPENRRMSPGLSRRKRGLSSDSTGERDDYGWFEDFESPALPRTLSQEFALQPLQRALTLPPPVTEAPMYILESSLETQELWYSTAGRRPKQPAHEREYFEKLWSKNFERSSVAYSDVNHPETRSKRSKNGDCVPKSEIQGEVLFRGKAPFSNSVSKSFLEGPLASMTLHIPYFRILRKLSGEIFAEFLIVVTLGSHNTPVTFGIWKRFSDFTSLAMLISTINLKSKEENNFKNASLSWQCVLQRKRWFKSLDKDYLSLKCFLLERFIHDVLFESQTPAMLIKFLGLEV